MDAHAHLISLGWAGTGHALDARPYQQKGHRGLAYDPKKASDTGNGLVKPLLVSQRHGRSGVGKKTHEPQAGNEWWLKGFESALGNIGKSESERSSGTATPDLTSTGRKHTGLYSFFVKGSKMEGTIDDVERRPSKKRKMDLSSTNNQGEDVNNVSTLEKGSAAHFEQVGAFIALGDQTQKPRQQVGKSDDIDDFVKIGQFFKVRSEKSRKRKSGDLETLQGTQSIQPPPPPLETKEQRRERRRRKKEQKEAALLNDDKKEDVATKMLRRAERKRRKEERIVKEI